MKKGEILFPSQNDRTIVRLLYFIEEVRYPPPAKIAKLSINPLSLGGGPPKDLQPSKSLNALK